MGQEDRDRRLRASLPLELLLIRHAEPDWEDRTQGGDPGLTQFGQEQAAQTADLIQALRIDAIYCSPMRRSRETADTIAVKQQLSCTVVSDLEEIRVPVLANLSQNEVDSYFAAAARRRLQERWSGFPGGEPFHAFHQRTTSAVESILGHYGVHSQVHDEFTVWNAPARAHPLRIAAVAHGGTNAVVMAHLLGIPAVPWEWIRFETPLAAVTILALRAISEESYIWSLQRFAWRKL